MTDIWEEKRLRLIKNIEYAFVDTELLRVSITHRSIRGKNNERLEFLGDSVLNFVIAAELYQRFPTANEGELTRLRSMLVRGETLANVARELEIGEHLYLGIGEEKSGGRQRSSILADALEAIIGAIYLDSSIEITRYCILKWYAARLNDLRPDLSPKDAKTRLQEYLQSCREALPEYQLAGMGGDAHNPIFFVYCCIALLKEPSLGIANTRRKAEQNAADIALKALLGV